MRPFLVLLGTILLTVFHFSTDALCNVPIPIADQFSGAAMGPGFYQKTFTDCRDKQCLLYIPKNYDDVKLDLVVIGAGGRASNSTVVTTTYPITTNPLPERTLEAGVSGEAGVVEYRDNITVPARGFPCSIEVGVSEITGSPSLSIPAPQSERQSAFSWIFDSVVAAGGKDGWEDNLERDPDNGEDFGAGGLAPKTLADVDLSVCHSITAFPQIGQAAEQPTNPLPFTAHSTSPLPSVYRPGLPVYPVTWNTDFTLSNQSTYVSSMREGKNLPHLETYAQRSTLAGSTFTPISESSFSGIGGVGSPLSPSFERDLPDLNDRLPPGFGTQEDPRLESIKERLEATTTPTVTNCPVPGAHGQNGAVKVTMRYTLVEDDYDKLPFFETVPAGSSGIHEQQKVIVKANKEVNPFTCAYGSLPSKRSGGDTLSLLEMEHSIEWGEKGKTLTLTPKQGWLDYLEGDIVTKRLEISCKDIYGKPIAIDVNFDVHRNQHYPVNIQTVAMATKDNIVYIAHRAGLSIMDVSNPLTPKILSSYKTDYPANSISLSDSHAYLLHRDLEMIDISDPNNPFLHKAIHAEDYDPRQIATTEKWAFFAGGKTGLRWAALRDPSGQKKYSPQDLQSWSHLTGIESADSVVAAGDLAVVTDSKNEKAHLLYPESISDPQLSGPIYSQAISDTISGPFCAGLSSIINNYLVLVESREGSAEPTCDVVSVFYHTLTFTNGMKVVGKPVKAKSFDLPERIVGLVNMGNSVIVSGETKTAIIDLSASSFDVEKNVTFNAGLPASDHMAASGQKVIVDRLSKPGVPVVFETYQYTNGQFQSSGNLVGQSLRGLASDGQNVYLSIEKSDLLHYSRVAPNAWQQSEPNSSGIQDVVNMKIRGNYLYYNNKNSFHIANASDRFRPREISRFDLGYVSDFEIRGGFAYISDSEVGVQILDISNPARPFRVSSNFDFKSAQAMLDVYDGRLYTTHSSQLTYFPISDSLEIDSPKQISYRNDFCRAPSDIALIDQYALIPDKCNGLVVVDTNPSRPFLPGISAATENKGIGYMSRIKIAGNRAFVTLHERGEKGIAVYDISNLGDRESDIEYLRHPRRPVLMDTISTRGYPFDIERHGDYLYISDYPYGLSIVYIGSYLDDKTSPKADVFSDNHRRVHSDEEIVISFDEEIDPGTLEISGDITEEMEDWEWDDDEKVLKIRPKDRWSIGTRTTFLLEGKDQAGNPISYEESGFMVHRHEGGLLLNSWMQDIEVQNNVVYVANDHSGLLLFDLSAEGSVSLRGSYETDGVLENLAVENDLVYLAEGENGLTIIKFDVDADPAEAPQYLGRWQGDFPVQDVAVVGNTAYLAAENKGLYVLDVGNPRSPELVQEIKGIDYALSLTLSGNYLYASGDSAGVYIIDLQDHRLIHHLKTDGPAVAVAVQTDRMYVAEDWNGVEVFAFANEGDPTVLVSEALLPTDGAALDLQANDTVLYVADYAKGLTIINLQNLEAAPSSIETAGLSLALDLDDSFVFLANGPAGMVAIPLADPTNPESRIGYATGDTAKDIAIKDNLAYLANGIGGLVEIDISDSKAPKRTDRSFTPSHNAQSVALLSEFQNLTQFEHKTDSEDSNEHNEFAVVADGSSGLAMVDLHEESDRGILPLDFSFSEETLAERFRGTAVNMDIQISYAHSQEGNVYAYVVDGMENVYIVDIDNLKKPQLKATFNRSGWDRTLGRFQPEDIVVNGNRAYVAAGPAGLVILNIQDPENPFFVKAITFGRTSPAVGIAYSRNYVYVATRQGGLKKVNVSNENNLELQEEVASDFIPDPDVRRAVDVTILAQRAFVADEYYGLVIYDIGGQSPTVVEVHETRGMPEGIAIDSKGKYAYVAETHYGLSVFYVGDLFELEDDQTSYEYVETICTANGDDDCQGFSRCGANDYLGEHYCVDAERTHTIYVEFEMKGVPSSFSVSCYGSNGTAIDTLTFNRQYIGISRSQLNCPAGAYIQTDCNSNKFKTDIVTTPTGFDHFHCPDDLRTGTSEVCQGVVSGDAEIRCRAS